MLEIHYRGIHGCHCVLATDNQFRMLSDEKNGINAFKRKKFASIESAQTELPKNTEVGIFSIE